MQNIQLKFKKVNQSSLCVLNHRRSINKNSPFITNGYCKEPITIPLSRSEQSNQSTSTISKLYFVSTHGDSSKDEGFLMRNLQSERKRHEVSLSFSKHIHSIQASSHSRLAQSFSSNMQQTKAYYSKMFQNNRARSIRPSIAIDNNKISESQSSIASAQLPPEPTQVDTHELNSDIPNQGMETQNMDTFEEDTSDSTAQSRGKREAFRGRRDSNRLNGKSKKDKEIKNEANSRRLTDEQKLAYFGEIDKILHENPKKSLLHYRLLYICGDRDMHVLSHRKKILNRILEACVAQNYFDLGCKIFYKYFTLLRNIDDEQQQIANQNLPMAEFEYSGHRNALGLGSWDCPDCSTHNESNIYKCKSCDAIRDEYLLGKGFYLDQRMKSLKIELMRNNQSLSESEEIALREEIENSMQEEDYFPDLPPIKANYDTFHLYANLCARSGKTDELLKLLDTMSENGWNPSIGIYISLLRMHVESGNYQAFFDSFNQFFKEGGLEPDVSTLRLLSRVLRAERSVEELENLFEHMMARHRSSQENYEPGHTFKSAFTSIPRSKLDWKQYHVKMDVVILNDLLAVYADIGETEKLLGVLDMYVQKASDETLHGYLIEPTINTFNYALKAVASISDGESFDRIWKEMKAWSVRKPRIKPNTLTYNAMLRLYKGINATSYVSDILANYFQTSPKDSLPNKVPPNEETWMLLVETFHSKIDTLQHISTWMNRFELAPQDRYKILFLGLYSHLECDTVSPSSPIFLQNIFERYNRFGHPLNEDATILLCKILLRMEELGFVKHSNLPYWEMTIKKLTIRSIEKETMKDNTFNALIELGKSDYETWKNMISDTNSDHQEFCIEMIRLFFSRNGHILLKEQV